MQLKILFKLLSLFQLLK